MAPFPEPPSLASPEATPRYTVPLTVVVPAPKSTVITTVPTIGLGPDPGVNVHVSVPELKSPLALGTAVDVTSADPLMKIPVHNVCPQACACGPPFTQTVLPQPASLRSVRSPCVSSP